MRILNRLFRAGPVDIFTQRLEDFKIKLYLFTYYQNQKLMKKFTLIAALCISAMGQAQITLEHSYPSNSSYMSVGVTELSMNGYKYMVSDNQSGLLQLYNLNHSLFKSIILPHPAGASIYVSNVSDSLFNTNSQIEVLYSYSLWNSTYTIYTCQTSLIDENGNSILSLPQSQYPYVQYAGAGNGYKMIVSVDSANKTSIKQVDVYSLVGGLPVHQTHANPGQPNGLVVNAQNNPFMSSAMPNPSQGKTTIAYQLPADANTADIAIFDLSGKEIKRFTVDRTFSTLELDNTDLPSGTYLYQLSTSSGRSDTKKMIVIK